jgi:hypothetical protein
MKVEKGKGAFRSPSDEFRFNYRDPALYKTSGPYRPELNPCFDRDPH